MFFFNQLFNELLAARDKFFEDTTFEMRQHTENINGVTHTHKMYYNKNGTLMGMSSEAVYTPSAPEMEINRLQSELKEVLALDSSEGYSRAAEIKKELIKLEKSLQKV